MANLKFVSVTLILGIPSATPGIAQIPAGRPFYVSDVGNDAADGNSPRNAFKTPERAIVALRHDRSRTVVYLTGMFERRFPLNIDRTVSGTEWRAQAGMPARFIAVGEAPVGLNIAQSDNVTVEGLSFVGFSRDGIRVSDSKNIRISNNSVYETRSTGWSQGAIHLTGTVAGATISNNKIYGADYAGIIVDTKLDSSVSNVKILSNTVNDTCRRVSDCGAIYINDRGRRSFGSVISNNLVSGFGEGSVIGRAIYLDDWASSVTVTENNIEGPGYFAFQIHGGSYNVISKNRVYMNFIKQVLNYHSTQADVQSNMSENYIVKNTFIGRQAVPTLSLPNGVKLTGGPTLLQNKYCMASFRNKDQNCIALWKK